MKSNVTKTLCEKIKWPLTWLVVILAIAAMVAAYVNGIQMSTLPAEPVEPAVASLDSPAAWMTAYATWAEIEAETYPHYQVGDFSEGGEYEEIVFLAEEFVKEHDGQISYVMLYKGMVFVEVEESTDEGSIWWLIVFAYDPEIGWVLVDIDSVLTPD